MFSVIIPLYNKAAYIEKAIQSVMSQTYQDFELIVVDDGSTDNSLAVAKNLQLSTFNFQLLTQSNQGVSTARNNGVKLAKYEFIAFLDADDWWAENFLEKMKQLIEEYPDAGVYGCQYFKIKNGKLIESKNNQSKNFAGYIDYFSAYTFAWWMPLTSSSVVIPKMVLKELSGFNAKLKFGEDLHLWLRITLKYKVAYRNECLAYYNQDVDVNNRALGGKIWKKEEHVLFNLNFLKEHELKSPELKYLLDGLRLRSLYVFYRNKIYQKELAEILSLIDFSKHEFIYYFSYKFPFWITTIYFKFKVLGSKIKQQLFR